MAKKKGSDIPKVPVPEDRWQEMLARAGGDPALAQTIWSGWMFHDRPEPYNPLDDPEYKKEIKGTK